MLKLKRFGEMTPCMHVPHAYGIIRVIERNDYAVFSNKSSVLVASVKPNNKCCCDQ